LIRQTRFVSALELETTWSHYFAIDNHSIPQRALGHLSPVQALKQWRIKQPELFDKRVYKQAGLDSLLAAACCAQQPLRSIRLADVHC
jgi:hypothetical protein